VDAIVSCGRFHIFVDESFALWMDFYLSGQIHNFFLWQIRNFIQYSVTAWTKLHPLLEILCNILYLRGRDCIRYPTFHTIFYECMDELASNDIFYINVSVLTKTLRISLISPDDCFCRATNRIPTMRVLGFLLPTAPVTQT